MTIHEVKMLGDNKATIDVTIEGVRREVSGFAYDDHSVTFYGVGGYVGRTGTKVWNCQVRLAIQRDCNEARRYKVPQDKWYICGLSNGVDYRSNRMAMTFANRIVGWFDLIPEARRAKK